VASATVQQSIDSNYTFTQQLTVPQPQLWSPRNPVLYRLMTTVSVNGQVTDTFYTVTGIRTVTIDSRNGLQVNGESLKLKGGCIHHDHGPLGAASYDRAEERKVEILRAAGYNAIRLSHNPPAPALLDACDRLGMLVIDEAFDCWEEKKNTSDYHLYFKEWWQRDLESMVLRDRNHPSVILWSTGNEIPNRDKPAVVAVSRKLSDYLHQLDPTRPVTCGVNGIGPDKDPFLATLDVAGYNYARDKYAADHDRLPERVMYGSESFPIESYDYWMAVEKYPSVIGDFVWTAWDYIGEASIGWLGYPQRQYFYPWNLAYCGDIDICGWKRPQSFYRDALWKDTALSLFVQSPVPSFDTAAYKEPWSNWQWLDVWPSWNWKGFEGRPLQVQAFASCDSVQLYLNNRFIGTQRTTRQDRYKATFSVPYTPGTLKAVGYLGGRAVKTALLQTAGAPAGIRAAADRQEMHADGQDLSYITIEITDAQGRPVPVAANDLQFTVSGPAKITGVGNADPRSIESCQASHRKAWKGRCLVILQSSKKAGPVQLTIRAAGLKTTSLQLRVK
jgi:beta-galactosidase